MKIGGPATITIETLNKMRAVLSEQNVEPRNLQPFIVRCTPAQAAEIAAACGVALRLDGRGEQLIGQFLIITNGA